MTTYEGTTGIAQLKAKIKQKSKLLIGESAEKVAVHLIDNSVIGAPYYGVKGGEAVENDQGDFKNSWQVGLGDADRTIREADPSGSAAIANAIVKGKAYNMQEKVYVTNNAALGYCPRKIRNALNCCNVISYWFALRSSSLLR